jgi:hypothetical protein
MNFIVTTKNSGLSKLRLVDKDGNPYSNVRFFLAVNNGYLSDTHDQGYFLTSDSSGFADITSMPGGHYSLIIADFTAANNSFLWANNWRYVGHFQKVSDLNVFQIMLPRIVLFEQALNSSAPNLLSTYKKYYAQAVTISQDTPICGVGFGIGYIKGSNPSTLQIRKNANGRPEENILYEAKTNSFTGAASYGDECSYADLCATMYAKALLPAGTYWIVAKYNEIPSVIAVIGDDSALPLSNLPIMASDDGLAWSNYEPKVWYNGDKVYKRLEYFFSE